MIQDESNNVNKAEIPHMMYDAHRHCSLAIPPAISYIYLSLISEGNIYYSIIHLQVIYNCHLKLSIFKLQNLMISWLALT